MVYMCISNIRWLTFKIKTYNGVNICIRKTKNKNVNSSCITKKLCTKLHDDLKNKLCKYERGVKGKVCTESALNVAL